MVIRDLTLSSAASFGSFHLIRLLYDEYMFYLVEHRVAMACGETSIAVMGEFLHTASQEQQQQQQLHLSIKEDADNHHLITPNSYVGITSSSSSLAGKLHLGQQLQDGSSSGPSKRPKLS